MYTILMNNDKSLTSSIKTTLYQRENLVDKIQILILPSYEDIDLTDAIVELKYLDQANVPHVEILQKDEELYKGRIRCTLPVDTNLTKYAGDVSIRITLTKINYETNTQYVLHTSEAVITILPIRDYYNFVPNESLEFVDRIVGALESKMDALDAMTNVCAENRVDDLAISDNKLHVSANGKLLGNGVTIQDNSLINNESGLNTVEL